MFQGWSQQDLDGMGARVLTSSDGKQSHHIRASVSTRFWPFSRERVVRGIQRQEIPGTQLADGSYWVRLDVVEQYMRDRDAYETRMAEVRAIAEGSVLGPNGEVDIIASVARINELTGWGHLNGPGNSNLNAFAARAPEWLTATGEKLQRLRERNTQRDDGGPYER